jgi:RimJ/RimL family protein N-acetyltransferase
MERYLRSEEVRLGTPRLILRAPQMWDAPSITALMNDWDVVRMLAAPPFPYRLRHARDWLARETMRRVEGTSWAFALTRREDAAGFCIGACVLEQREDRYMHLGFWLGRPFWRRGLMTEATTSVVRYGFTVLNLPRIQSGYFTDNAASRRIHERLGFTVTSEDTLYCVPRQAETPHVNVTLSRQLWREPVRPLSLLA